MFAEETGLDPAVIFADPDNVTYDALGFYKGLARTFFNPATPFSINQRLLKDGGADLKEILPRWKPWIPPKLEQGLQQGGMLIFQGKECLYSHYDESTGAHADLEDVLSMAVFKNP
mmetsp:Transcript_18632/g.52061  ORF Transcript_18632/g.52061 Transcript_18632/m.52061 type:complete len:116 (+) Transcript_18632:562-909(+)